MWHSACNLAMSPAPSGHGHGQILLEPDQRGRKEVSHRMKRFGRVSLSLPESIMAAAVNRNLCTYIPRGDAAATMPFRSSRNLVGPSVGRFDVTFASSRSDRLRRKFYSFDRIQSFGILKLPNQKLRFNSTYIFANGWYKACEWQYRAHKHTHHDGKEKYKRKVFATEY